MRNENTHILVGQLEAATDAFEEYVIRNATFELNHDSVLAFIQRQRELCEDLKRAQLLDQLSASVDFRQELAGAFRKEQERLRKEHGE